MSPELTRLGGGDTRDLEHHEKVFKDAVTCDGCGSWTRAGVRTSTPPVGRFVGCCIDCWNSPPCPKCGHGIIEHGHGTCSAWVGEGSRCFCGRETVAEAIQ